jgi:hypothetical protein
LTFWDFCVFEISQLHEYIIAGIRGNVKPPCQFSKCLGVFHRAVEKPVENYLGGVSEGLG